MPLYVTAESNLEHGVIVILFLIKKNIKIVLGAKELLELAFVSNKWYYLKKVSVFGSQYARKNIFLNWRKI